MKQVRQNTYVEQELQSRREAKIRDIFNQIFEFLGKVALVAVFEAILIAMALAWC